MHTSENAQTLNSTHFRDLLSTLSLRCRPSLIVTGKQFYANAPHIYLLCWLQSPEVYYCIIHSSKLTVNTRSSSYKTYQATHVWRTLCARLNNFTLYFPLQVNALLCNYAVDTLLLINIYIVYINLLSVDMQYAMHVC